MSFTLPQPGPSQHSAIREGLHVPAGPGDIVFIPRTVRHRFRNVGLHDCEMLFLFTPGGPENIFIEGGDEPQPGQRPELWVERLTKLANLMEKYGIEARPRTLSRGLLLGGALIRVPVSGFSLSPAFPALS